MPTGRTPLELLEEGRADFNSGRFFEAHERWEEAWLIETGPTKLLLQGLIQIAAGFLKAGQGRSAASARLLESGVRKVAEAGTPPELDGFVADVRQRTESSRETAVDASTWPLLPPMGSVK